MEIRPYHIETIQILIEHSFAGTLNKTGIAAEIGKTRRTIQNWCNDPDFQAAYAKELERWKADLSSVRFAERKARVIELQRLYDETPISAGVNKSSGLEVLNTTIKAKLLDQIAAEVGDKVEKHAVDIEHRGQVAVEHIGISETLALAEAAAAGADAPALSEPGAD